jgi:site-specific DNA recombinase
MIRCAIYRRVSSPKQKDGVSLLDQESICRAYAASKGWIVVADYVEAGKSAFTEKLTKRTAFQQLLRDAQARMFDIVLVYKMNRFARKVLIQYQAAADLERCKVEIASATEPIDRKTASGRLTFGMLAVIAEAQSDQLSEKMRDTRAAEARQGRHVGPIPTGFRRENGVLIPIESIAAAQLAFSLYATRVESYTTVADALNNAGYRTNGGQGFSKFQVAEMLSNPVYIGRVRCKDQEYAGQHAPVIDQALWETVQREIQRRVRGVGLRQPSSPALLSGLARCSNCGEPMWYTPGRGGHYNYYACRGRAQGGREPRCNLGMVRAEMAEGHALASLMTLVGDKTILSAVADELATLARREQPVRPAIDRARIELRLKRIGQLYADDVMNEEEYQHERDRLKAQLHEQAPAVSYVPQLGSVLSMLSDVPQLVEGAPLTVQRALLTEVFEVIYVMPHQAMAARPMSSYAAILQRSRLKIMGRWAGWAPSFYPLNFNPQIPPMLIAA